MERLRDTLLDRLDAIEALALELANELDSESSDRERALRDRVAVLEASLARTQAEYHRRAGEWEEEMSKLENDRRLLAEAWERWEQLQIQADPRADPRLPPSATPAVLPAHTVPAHATHDDPNDPVTRAMLRQFQKLAGDVRRNALDNADF